MTEYIQFAWGGVGVKKVQRKESCVTEYIHFPWLGGGGGGGWLVKRSRHTKKRSVTKHIHFALGRGGVWGAGGE